MAAFKNRDFGTFFGLPPCIVFGHAKASQLAQRLGLVRGRFRHSRANTALRSRSHDAFENRGVSFFPTTDDDELYYETT